MSATAKYTFLVETWYSFTYTVYHEDETNKGLDK
jgi:hypothetical protein